MSVVLVNLPAKVDTLGTQQTFRFGTEAYEHKDSTVFYHGRIIEVQNLRRQIFSNGTTFGQSRTTDGRLVLAAIGADFDGLDRYGFNLETEFLLGDSIDTPLANFSSILKCVAEAASVERETIEVQLTDRRRELLTSVSPAKYDGSNSGTTGLESTLEELQGQHKIRLFGRRDDIRPHLLNRPAQIFGVNHDTAGARAAATINSVSVDVGTGYAAWTKGTDHATEALLQAATPVQGVFDTCNAKGLFKMGGTIDSDALSKVVVDATEGADANARSCAGIMQRLLLEHVSSGDINATDYSAFLSANGDTTGIVIDDAKYYPAVLDEIAGYAGGYWSVNSANEYTMGQVIAPSAGTPVATFRLIDQDVDQGANDFDLIDIRPISNRDGNVPYYRVNNTYDEQYAEDTAVLNQFPSRELDFNIYFHAATDRLTELLRRLGLYKVPRRAFEVDVQVTGSPPADIGDVVTIYHPRFGFVNGLNALIVGDSLAVKSEKLLTYEVWV